MPTNQLAPPDLPGLFMRSIGVPNALGPPDLQRPSMQNTPPLAAPPPTDGTMTPADVWSFNRDNLGDAWQAAQDPATWREAAQNFGDAMLMGSVGPEGKGFTAYHGSPHAFDQFDLSKIGTGEGAQAYGHGMYLADSEGVARSYRDTLSQEQGPTISWIDSAGKKLDMDALQGSNGPQSSAAYMLNQRGSVDEALADVQKYGPGAFAGGKPEMDGVISALQQFKDAGLTKQVNRGHMYEVNVNADPAKFLDWDAPLSEQHPDVQAAVKGAEGIHPSISGDTTGETILGTLQNYHGSSADAAQVLQQAGIPGIRYLDQGSRGAGAGTKNSVVFDAATMNIIRRYGLAGLLGGGAAAAATQQPSQ